MQNSANNGPISQTRENGRGEGHKKQVTLTSEPQRREMGGTGVSECSAEVGAGPQTAAAAGLHCKSAELPESVSAGEQGQVNCPHPVTQGELEVSLCSGH
jgi:hypothetical protein